MQHANIKVGKNLIYVPCDETEKEIRFVGKSTVSCRRKSLFSFARRFIRDELFAGIDLYADERLGYPSGDFRPSFRFLVTDRYGEHVPVRTSRATGVVQLCLKSSP